MSSISRWSYTNIATVWKAGAKDHLNGGTVWGAPYTIACTWTATVEMRTAPGGKEFAAMMDFFHEDPRPGVGDRICRGDYTTVANPTLVTGLTEVVRAHTQWDMSPFGNELPDYRTTI